MLVQTIFGYFNMWVIRTAVLILYIRIFNSVRWVRLTSWTIIALSGAFYTTSIFLSVANCTPRAGEDWASVSFAKCADPIITKYVELHNSIFSVFVTDEVQVLHRLWCGERDH
jgi:hypothetical protein